MADRMTGPLAVVGAGGVGGYFAGALAAAGYEVHVLARGAHLDAMRANSGLEIVEPDGTHRIAPVRATDDATALTGAKFVIIAVKSYSLADVAPVLQTLATTGSVIVPLLNGVGTDERLAALGVNAAAVAGGLTYISAARTAPGVVQRFSPFRRIIVGEFQKRPPDRLQPLAAALREAGVDTTITGEIDAELWRKLAFIAPLAAVCGLALRAVGPVRSAPFGREVFERAVREVVAVARASGVAFDDAATAAIVADMIQRFDTLHPDTKPSLLLDLERNGPTELDALSGAIARLGRAAGVDTPVHDTAVAAISAR
jgi:2-dehydropantoate 2-reductase